MNMKHPIVMPDGRVPCDCCDALITTSEAEANFPRWQQHICNICAQELAEANPQPPLNSTPRIRVVCARCGSENVFADACARWDFDTQAWVLTSTYDSTNCEDCNDECRIECRIVERAA